MKTTVRLAVVGGSRGAYFSRSLNHLGGRAELVAVCDTDEGVLQKWKEDFPEVVGYSSYERLLEDPQVDAVFLATPLLLHASQAILAMKKGKHVMSEVIAAHTLEDSWELAETVEQTGLTYMMAENYCYMRSNMMIKNMVSQGAFGEITSAECGYIHDCRSLLHNRDGSLTWRGRKQRDFCGSTYPTHSLGPVSQWLGINREGGDEFDSLVTFSSKSRSTAKYFHEHFGGEHPGAGADFWKQGDSTVTLIRTKKGVVITLKYDTQSARPHNMTHYELQGTKGAYLSPRYDSEEPLIWLENQSAGAGAAAHAGREPEWGSLWNHADEWEHPLWKRWGEEANKAGHGGGDFFVLDEFVSAILEQRKPAIDVIDAITWSSVFPLSIQSIAEGGRPVKFVNFKHK
ncbi:Gfo/Idh/MocA family protein [Paenibacillus nasutitermitis]|uniref:Alpha-N-acetylgalactosaminidase n=1 Tax=Paenibacillus nasutitermitis TaxID=1652958 RepID=A0A916Z7Y3_9BACL|nr:Gfo/Idh/MocA family oxidoreductase [Paenibacillus nasutitermitis]GGD79478.1 alpha-N-acetylgalactosaminidase [Paenibacillus nasutitermitis]